MSEGSNTAHPDKGSFSDGSGRDAEFAELCGKLDAAGREAFRVWARWACEDGRPETDPLQHHPAWAEFRQRVAAHQEA